MHLLSIAYASTCNPRSAAKTTQQIAGAMAEMDSLQPAQVTRSYQVKDLRRQVQTRMSWSAVA